MITGREPKKTVKDVPLKPKMITVHKTSRKLITVQQVGSLGILNGCADNLSEGSLTTSENILTMIFRTANWGHAHSQPE